MLIDLTLLISIYVKLMKLIDEMTSFLRIQVPSKINTTTLCGQTLSSFAFSLLQEQGFKMAERIYGLELVYTTEFSSAVR